MAEEQFSNYEDFFTFYLHEHSDPRNRAMHAAGTTLGLCTLIVPFMIGRPWYALLWPVVAYSFAWTGHFLIEGNKPATFGHPFWFYQRFQNAGADVDRPPEGPNAGCANSGETPPSLVFSDLTRTDVQSL
jgi:hypothetical protein